MSGRFKESPQSWILQRTQTDERGCWIWTLSKDKNGYGRASPGDETVRAHRLSYAVFKGDVGELQVLHKCDVPSCVNPEHLFLGTHADNVADRGAKGRHPRGAMCINKTLRYGLDNPAAAHPERMARGEKNGNAVLTEGAARAVLSLRGKASSAAVAAAYGCSPATVQLIWKRATWKHLVATDTPVV